MDGEAETYDGGYKRMSIRKGIQEGIERSGYHIKPMKHVLSGVEKCHSGTWFSGLLA